MAGFVLAVRVFVGGGKLSITIVETTIANNRMLVNQLNQLQTSIWRLTHFGFAAGFLHLSHGNTAAHQPTIVVRSHLLPLSKAIMIVSAGFQAPCSNQQPKLRLRVKVHQLHPWALNHFPAETGIVVLTVNIDPSQNLGK